MGGSKISKCRCLTPAGQRRIDATKSKRQDALTKKFKKMGLTEEEAKIAAYKQRKTEKILAVTAGLTVTAAAAYVAYKHYDDVFDKVIKTDSTLYNVSTNSDRGVQQAFYASLGRGDRTKYNGIYADHLRKGSNGMFNIVDMNNDVYETTVRTKENLKVASRRSATEVLKNMLKNDSEATDRFAAELVSMRGAQGTDKQNQVIEKAIQSLRSGKIDGNVYDAFNYRLTQHTPESQKVTDRFYEAMKKKGYDAIADVNDRRYSGYNAKSATIVFNGGSKVDRSGVRKLTVDEIEKSKKKAMDELTNRQVAKSLAVNGATIAGAAATMRVSLKMDERARVAKYRKEHPKSKLTYAEIAKKTAPNNSRHKT